MRGLAWALILLGFLVITAPVAAVQVDRYRCDHGPAAAHCHATIPAIGGMIPLVGLGIMGFGVLLLAIRRPRDPRC